MVATGSRALEFVFVLDPFDARLNIRSVKYPAMTPPKNPPDSMLLVNDDPVDCEMNRQ